EPLDAFPRRARPQVPMTILPISVWSERISEEVEALVPGVPDRGLRLVEHKPQPCHHLPRPRQSLGRVSTAEDNEVIGIRDYPAPKGLVPFRPSPVLQKAVHVDVGQRRAENPTLWGATSAVPATCQAPFSVTICLLDRCFEPQFDQVQHMPVDDAPSNRLNQFLV